ncbi:uncharacterized protein LOC121383824 [Gigantopelta aegis]|uniref:uncharacterized protein LOC121383824 n=1 Tax=Gigantopelta aegis TaxID=1735272 RepID=UPI001B8876C9|nr:uncharacterized protein LOC121383824 [Gigantopelta aegis]
MIRTIILGLACLWTTSHAVHLIQLSAPTPQSGRLELSPNFIRNVLDMDVITPTMAIAPFSYGSVAPQQSVAFTRAVAPVASQRRAQHMPRKANTATTRQGLSPLLLRSLMDVDGFSYSGLANQAFVEYGGQSLQPAVTYSSSVAPTASAATLAPAQHMPMKRTSTGITIPPMMLRNILDLDVYGGGSMFVNQGLSAYDTQAVDYGTPAYASYPSDGVLVDGGQGTFIIG